MSQYASVTLQQCNADMMKLEMSIFPLLIVAEMDGYCGFAEEGRSMCSQATSRTYVFIVTSLSTSIGAKVASQDNRCYLDRADHDNDPSVVDDDIVMERVPSQQR